ncbi:MAG: helix-turn-helix transcriptional regulator [Candidatus Gastranaerophilales bacterium]|nr:helix-turn-helix transcriptional regulator [Candidatus Gastranaerophilales bacterium]
MNEDVYKQFATKVQKLRKAKGYTKSMLSSLADLDISYIGKIERCEKSPNLRTIIKLANALEVPVKELFEF